MNVTSARIYICANITFTGTADMEKEGKVGRTSGYLMQYMPIIIINTRLNRYTDK